jgi:PAS domain S-box-containing protein
MSRPVPVAADTAAQLLRQKAEASAGPEATEFAPLSHEETRRALHELCVHQIELEMQNEQLRIHQIALELKNEQLCQTLGELDASRARYFDFYDLAPVGYCSVDKAGLFLHANLTMAAWLGVAREQLKGQPISRFIAKDDQDIFYLRCKQVIATGEAQAGELRLRKPDATQFWVSVGAIATSDESGVPALRIVLSDVTARKSAEAARRRSELHLRTSVDNLNFGFLLQSPTSQVLFSNPVAATLLGLTEAQLRGKTCFDPQWNVIHEDGSPFPGHTHPVPMAIATGHSVRNVVMGVHRPVTCDMVWLSVSATPEFGDDGELLQVVCTIADITALKNSQDRFKAVLDGAADAIFITDLQGRYQYANRKACELLGYEQTEMLAMSIPDITPAEDLPGVMVQFSQVATDGFLLDEFELMRKDGGRVPVELSAIKLPEDEIFGSCRDITKRRLMEKLLEESTTFKRTILDSISAQVAVLDCKGVIVEVNEPWRRFSLENCGTAGMPAGHTDPGVNYLEICGASRGDSADGAPAAHDGIRKVLDGLLPHFSLEYPCHSPTVQRWFEMSVTPLATAHGGAVVVHTDITERRLAAEAVQVSETKYRTLMEQAAEAVVVADMSGTILEVNSRAAALLGYEEDDLPGLNISMIHPAAEMPRVAESFAAFERMDRVEILETQVLTKQGRSVPVGISAKAIALTGRKVAMGIFRDLSEQHQRDAQRLREEKAHRDALVREVHHRIKNSLQGVTGILRELAQRKPEMTSDLDTVISQIGSIALVHGISGAESGGRVTLCALVADITRNARMLWQRDIVVDIKHDCHHCVINEKEAVPLALVLNELLANACKHSAAGGVSGKLEIAVECNINGDADGAPVRARVRIVNPGHLAPGFDFGSKRGLGTGLRLVAALLPKHGAILVLTQQPVGVETLLELSAPVFAESLIEEGTAA